MDTSAPSNQNHTIALLPSDYRALFEASPAPVLVLATDDPVFTVLTVSDAYLGILKIDRELLKGKGAFQLFPDSTDGAALSFVQALRESFGRVLCNRVADQMPAQTYFLRTDVGGHGTNGDLNVRILNSPVLGADGRVARIMHSIEVSSPADSRQGAGDTFSLRLEDTLRPLADPIEMTQTAARLLGEELHADRCTFLSFEPDQAHFHITSDYSRPGLPKMLGRYELSQFGAAAMEAMRAGVPYIVNVNSGSSVIASQYPFNRFGIRAYLLVPLKKAEVLVAALFVAQTIARQWAPHELDLVQLVANRCWESLERARILRESRHENTRLRLAQRAGRTGSFEWLIKENKVSWAPELEALYGVPEGSFEGTLEAWRSRVLPEDAERVLQSIASIVAQQQSEHFYEFRAVLPDGTLRWLRGQAQFSYDETGAPEQMVGVNMDIDAQKRAEADLRQQWKSFDAALSNTPDFVYTFDLEGRFTYMNRALLTLLHLPLEAALGKSFQDLDYPPELTHRLQRQIQQVIETRSPVRDDTPFQRPEGEVRFYDYIFVPVLSADGRVEAVAGSTRDITDRNRAEKLVQEDNRRWRELLQQAPAAIAVLRGPEHHYDWVNTGYSTLVGRPAEALVGKPLREALPEIVSQGYAEMFDRVYQTGEPHIALEAHARLGDRTLREVYVNFVCLPTRSSDGRIDGTFVHFTDVTDLVLARKHMEESERQFRTLAETIPHLAWMADETGSIFWYNRRWYEYTGTSFEEMKGWGWQEIHDPNVLPDVVTQWTAAIVSGQPFEMTFPLRGADGEFCTFLTRVEPVRDNNGRVVRWFGTNTDITGQRKIEEELRRMNRELEEFAYVASHDLQEPLRMVNIYTQLMLKNSGSPDAKLQQYSDFVRQGVTRMEALIAGLLTFSRTVHSEQLFVGTADLSAALSEALVVLKNRIEESDATITSQGMPLVRGDTEQIAHVFQNLLSNALKYQRAGVRPEIHVSVSMNQGQCTVTVRDNGIGFEPQYADRIFGLFKRLHKDEYPGTGLGLPICRRIVERFGGRMWAEGRPGLGATFYFSLPCMEEQ